MDTVELINELAISIDADMREQHRNTRRDFPLKLEWAQALTRCPDWPAERVASLAASKERWYAADVAELALVQPPPIPMRVASGTILAEPQTPLSVGDAVWLLTQTGALPRKVLVHFAVSCAWWACEYAMDAHVTLPIIQLQTRVEREGKIDWRRVEFSYRITSRMLDSIKQSIHGAEACAWRFHRAARAAGAVHTLLLDDKAPLEPVQRIAQMATLCAISPLPEQTRQLRHLHALVS